MTDTIKITREMLREAWLTTHIKSRGPSLLVLEKELFGPEKPREVWLAIDGDRIVATSVETTAPSIITYLGKAPSAAISWRKFREVLGD